MTDCRCGSITRCSIGCLKARAGQIITARAHGRMVGYLMSIIGPSLENSNLSVGTQAAFYVEREYWGAGLLLARASVEAQLWNKGVGEIISRDGVRGNGPQLGALYRRLGARDHGRLYCMTMGEA